MRHGSSINDLAIGDPVAFERLDDHVSGARALRVTKNDGRTQASERSS
jgi:hypothetical protein